MSRLFDENNSNYLSASSAALPDAPLMISLWFRVTDLSTTNDQVLFNIGKAIGTKGYRIFIDIARTGDLKLAWEVETATESWDIKSISALNENQWYHVAVREIASDARQLWLDGVFQNGNSTDLDPGGLDVTYIGKDVSYSDPFAGDISHVALWNTVLTEIDCKSLAAGVSPLRINRGGLVNYWPLNGQSPETDIVGGLHMTVNGSLIRSTNPPRVRQPMKAGT